MKVLTIYVVLILVVVGAAPIAAQDDQTTFTVRIENISAPLLQVGLFENEMTFEAAPTYVLSFVIPLEEGTFLAPPPDGIPLFDADEAPLEGDIQVEQWYLDEQARVQPSETESNPTGHLIHEADTFIFSLESGSGIFAIHPASSRLFVPNAPPRPELIEFIETGDSQAWEEFLTAYRFASPLSPGFFAVHWPTEKVFEVGMPASFGLQALAEDGNPGGLIEEMVDWNISTIEAPEGGEFPGPAMPGDLYQFTLLASPGQVLTFGTMFLESNDTFLAIDSLPLWDEDGNPRTGDITAFVRLYDAGSEINEPLGTGPNQAMRQPDPWSFQPRGEDENGIIQLVESEEFPQAVYIVQVTITVE